MPSSTAFATTGAGLLLAVAMPTSAASLTVTFAHPESYTDAGYSREFPSERERAEVQRDLERHLQGLAARRLGDGDVLSIEVFDIDLAGDFEPFAFGRPTDLRIVRDITWPRLKLRYTLTRDGATVASREEVVSDQSFLMSVNPYSSSDRLRYEKAMLDGWFERRFRKP